MANRLKMATVQSILSLHARGWSQRRIARELGVDRESVARHLRLARESAPAARSDREHPEPAIAPISSPGSAGPKPAKAPLESAGSADSKPANAPIPATGSAALETLLGAPSEATASGRQSDCEPWREVIQAKQVAGLSARRIHQDLVAEHAAEVSYDSVRRFLRRLGWVRPLPFRRLECAPGQEAQVDFGTGAPIVGADGKRRRTHVFRIVLSHSRKAYSEVTYRQTTDDFLHALENAFHHFGGVPQTLVIDNLKAAVKHPDWFDPELVPKVAAFAAHYGTVILPTKPYTPRHKGKVERGIDYVQENGLQGRTFASLTAENEHLLDWETKVADTRIHGTTKRHVGRVFEEVERPTLQPLPRERFTSFHEAQRKVSRDGHVEVAKAYYSVPPEYVTRTVWVRWDARLVRVFNHRFEQLRVHARQEPGRFSSSLDDVHPQKISGLERGAAYLLKKASVIGPHTERWAEAMLTARGIEGTRVLLGLLSLTKKHAGETLENACETALSYGAFRLRTLRQLLNRRAAKQTPLPFLDEHPLIRPLDDYARVVAAALVRQEDARRAGCLRHGSGVRGAIQQASPDGLDHQGSGVCSTRPRSSYPSPGCASAEPGSVSPDASSVVPLIPLHQEKSTHA
jgi:transposase